MIIGCPRGNVNGSHPLAHKMTAGEVEQLVYVLTAAVATAETEEESPEAGQDPVAAMGCPVEWLRVGRDPEMYAEHIEGMLVTRKAAAR